MTKIETGIWEVLEGGGKPSLPLAPKKRPRRKAFPEVASMRLISRMRKRVREEEDPATDMELEVLERFQRRAAADREELAALSLVAVASAGDLAGALERSGEFDRERAFSALENLNRALAGILQKVGIAVVAVAIPLAAAISVGSDSELEMRRASMRPVRVIRQEGGR